MVNNWGHLGPAGGKPVSPRRKVGIVYPLAALLLEDLFLVTHLGGSLLDHGYRFIEKSLSLKFSRYQMTLGWLKIVANGIYLQSTIEMITKGHEWVLCFWSVQWANWMKDGIFFKPAMLVSCTAPDLKKEMMVISHCSSNSWLLSG